MQRKVLRGRLCAVSILKFVLLWKNYKLLFFFDILGAFHFVFERPMNYQVAFKLIGTGRIRQHVENKKFYVVDVSFYQYDLKEMKKSFPVIPVLLDCDSQTAAAISNELEWENILKVLGTFGAEGAAIKILKGIYFNIENIRENIH